MKTPTLLNRGVGVKPGETLGRCLNKSSRCLVLSLNKVRGRAVSSVQLNRIINQLSPGISEHRCEHPFLLPSQGSVCPGLGGSRGPLRRHILEGLYPRSWRCHLALLLPVRLLCASLAGPLTWGQVALMRWNEDFSECADPVRAHSLKPNPIWA